MRPLPQPRPASVARRPANLVPWLACGAWLGVTVLCGPARAADPLPPVDLLTITELTAKDAATIRSQQATKPALAGSSDAQFEAAFKAAGMTPEQIDRFWQELSHAPRRASHQGLLLLRVMDFLAETRAPEWQRAANNWSGMSVDRKRGILFVPTGSAAYDFYGGNRPGENLFSDCLLALDARTGKRIWHYQFVHHDIWDRDLPAPPNLITLTRNGRRVDAVAQVTKQGYVFVFNRETGESLFDINEIPVPPSDLPGEITWPTQPIPVKPAPFARMSTSLTEADIPEWIADREKILQGFKNYRKEQWAPPSREGTLLFPGYDGAAEWGGAAADPETGILYVNANEMAWVMQMVEVPGAQALQALSPGERIYSTRCASCHGSGRQGNPASGFPALTGLKNRLDKNKVSGLIASGKGMMPGISLPEAEKEALLRFLFEEETDNTGSTNQPVQEIRKDQVPFVSTGYNKFLDANGLPAFSPPYGSMTAIDLNTGEHLWRIVLGEDPQLKKMGIRNTGTENYGGPVVTRNGLLFIAATKDGKFRAFDKKNGRLLWETDLPAASFATPATYEINGRQFIVLACGGTKLGAPKGNKYVAYALPER